MFGSQLLEVTFGLVFVYLGLSIVSSGILEILASIFKLRATTLEQSIRNMLGETNGNLVSDFYAHPLIAGTTPPGYKPSYISARMFAAALLDLIAPAQAGQPRTLESLRAAVSQIPDARLRATLLNIVDSAGGDVETARLKVAHWFDDTMARVTGWYKRLAQKIIFVAGLILCVAVNADTLMILKELWSDQALSSAIVAQAGQRVQSTSPAEYLNQRSSLQQLVGDIRDVDQPPIGWSRDPNDIRIWPGALGNQALKVLGILLTSFAVVLGAPFLFDILNKFINLRWSGAPPPVSD
jgi:hypothetical protein